MLKENNARGPIENTVRGKIGQEVCRNGLGTEACVRSFRGERIVAKPSGSMQDFALSPYHTGTCFLGAAFASFGVLLTFAQPQAVVNLGLWG